MTARITVISGECELLVGFLDVAQCARTFDILQKDINWQQHDVCVYNRIYKTPRLTAWYGDNDAVYQYSGSIHTPQAWTAPLNQIRSRVENHTNRSFNSVLLNYYRTGNDAMGRHSDDERELGTCPFIASVSLGGTRKFMLHPNTGNPESPVSINLTHGSLLLMYGKCQQRWKHSVPRTRKQTGSRINLTFRRIRH